MLPRGDQDGLDRAIISFCLHRNTTSSANGSVPYSFIFTKALRTRLSVQCTEKVIPAPVPVYIRAENRTPDPGELITKHGSNTNFSDENRLVHDADALPRRKDSIEDEKLSNSSKIPDYG